MHVYQICALFAPSLVWAIDWLLDSIFIGSLEINVDFDGSEGGGALAINNYLKQAGVYADEFSHITQRRGGGM